MIINATLCYIRRAGETLMMLRNRKPNDVHRGKYNGVGGKMIPGETPEACAAREIFEETGLIVDEMALRGILTFPCFDGANDWIVYVMLVTGFHGDLIECAEGELRWIETDRLEELPLWDGDRIFLKWLDRPGWFSGRFDYRNGNLISHEVRFYQ